MSIFKHFPLQENEVIRTDLKMARIIVIIFIFSKLDHFMQFLFYKKFKHQEIIL
jgi:hypothetical protein